MPRAKNRVASRARRKKIVSRAKGYFGRRKNNIILSKDAFFRAGKFAVRPFDLVYGEFIAGLKAKNIELDRKTLAYLALHEPESFKKVVELVKS